MCLSAFFLAQESQFSACLPNLQVHFNNFKSAMVRVFTQQKTAMLQTAAIFPENQRLNIYQHSTG